MPEKYEDTEMQRHDLLGLGKKNGGRQSNEVGELAVGAEVQDSPLMQQLEARAGAPAMERASERE